VPRLGDGVPETVHAIALLTLDSAHGLTGSSPLYAYDAGRPLRIEAGQGDLLIVGFEEDGLVARVGTEPLRAVGPCEAALPGPVWSAVWKDNGLLTVTATSGVPALTTTAFDAAETCPDSGDRSLEVDIRCSFDGSVPGPITLASGSCELTVDLGSEMVNGAALGSFRARVDAGGRLCVDPTGIGPSCSAVASDPADVTVQCTQPSCNLEVHLASALSWGLERFDLFAGGVQVMTASDTKRLVGLTAPPIANTGYAFDMARLPDRIVLATASGKWIDPHCDCDTKSVLLSLDIDGLQPIQTTTTGPCMTHFAADPKGDGVFAAELDPVSHLWVIRHYATNGGILASTTLADGTPGLLAPLKLLTKACGDMDQIDGYDPRAVVMLTGTSTRVAVLFGHYNHGGGDLVVLLDYDLHEIARQVLNDLDGRYYAAAYHGSRLVLGGNTLVWVDPEAGTMAVGQLELGVGTDSFELRDDALLGLVVPATGGLFFASYPPSMTAAAMDRTYGFVPSLVTTIDLKTNLMVAAGMWLHDNGSSRDAAFLVYDKVARRFQPGLQTIGSGLVSHLTLDRVGRVVALLPWSGQLVRLTPR
jgi:hypothetical protein